MSRGTWLFLLIMTVLVLAAVWMFRSYQDLYKTLPANLPTSVPVVQFEDWREFNAAKEGFKVMMPGLPQHAQDSVVDPKSKEKRKYNMYISQKGNGEMFMVNLITYPTVQDTMFPEKVFQGVVDDLLKTNPKNQLISSQLGWYQHYRSFEFDVQSDDAHMNGKAFIIDKTLYLLTYVAKPDAYNQADFQHFIETFQLSPLTQVESKATDTLTPEPVNNSTK